MLLAQLAKDHVECTSGYGFGAERHAIRGKHWDRVASDLVCGVADVLPDVGIVVTGKPWDVSFKTVTANAGESWASINAGSTKRKSAWSFSDSRAATTARGLPRGSRTSMVLYTALRARAAMANAHRSAEALRAAERSFRSRRNRAGVISCSRG